EVDALAADGEQAGDEAERGGAGGAEQDREFRREPPYLRRVRRSVAGAAEEHRVSERQQAAEADQQVECAREQREAHQLHEEYRIQHQRRQDEEGDHHSKSNSLMFHFCAPNSPAGRNNSTIAMMMKITVFDASG